jgi:CubicO group peptidase (beta-lactamase class C family)
MNPHANAAATAALHQAIDTLGEVGLQVVAIHRGQVVVDAWAGLADRDTGRLVDGDTLFTAFSMSKGVTATIVHRLVERGELAYDTPLAHWWPAFAQHGKGEISVRHALSHRAGLPTFVGLASGDQPSLAATGRHLEEATPEWAPGASMAYHGLTYGTLLGRVVECATGKPFAQVLHEEVTGPLGIDDLWCGVPDDPAVHARIATLMPSGDPAPETGHGPVTPEERAEREASARSYNSTAYRAGCMPAAGVVTTARALATHYAAMRVDGLRGVRLLRPETIAEATVPYFGADGNHVEWTALMGLGFALGAARHPHCGVDTIAPWPDAFGHTGYGGSISMYCPSQDLAVALTKNALAPSRFTFNAWALVLRAVTDALGIA